jgi:hypothetical protein
MNYDQYLESLRDRLFDAPDHFQECIVCGYYFDPQDLKMVEDLEDDLFYFIGFHYSDRLSQEICHDCIRDIKGRLARRRNGVYRVT